MWTPLLHIRSYRVHIKHTYAYQDGRKIDEVRTTESKNAPRERVEEEMMRQRVGKGRGRDGEGLGARERSGEMEMVQWRETGIEKKKKSVERRRKRLIQQNEVVML